MKEKTESPTKGKVGSSTKKQTITRLTESARNKMKPPSPRSIKTKPEKATNPSTVPKTPDRTTPSPMPNFERNKTRILTRMKRSTSLDRTEPKKTPSKLANIRTLTKTKSIDMDDRKSQQPTLTKSVKDKPKKKKPRPIESTSKVKSSVKPTIEDKISNAEELENKEVNPAAQSPKCSPPLSKRKEKSAKTKSLNNTKKALKAANKSSSEIFVEFFVTENKSPEKIHITPELEKSSIKQSTVLNDETKTDTTSIIGDF